MPFATMQCGYSGALEVRKVKCPNCGFVTFPDPSECKKCGHRFAPDVRRPKHTPHSVTFRSPDRPFSLSAPEPPGPAPLSEMAPKAQDAKKTSHSPAASEIESGQPIVQEGQRGNGKVTEVDAANPWHEEIVERVARYRRRRDREGQPEASTGTLGFDFDHPDNAARAGPATTLAAETELNRQGRTGELEFDLDEVGEFQQLDGALGRQGTPEPPEDAVEWALEPLDFQARERPVEVVLRSGRQEVDIEEQQPPDARPQVAPLGRRFAAGMLDVLVLVIAGAVFFLLFRFSGGHVDRQPVDVATMALAGALLAYFYFFAFTALAFATPGQSALGLRVRRFDGETPDVRASLWRGTGYLVSAILMLGFAWAVLDPEQLTWHDRMSGTCLVESR